MAKAQLRSNREARAPKKKNASDTSRKTPGISKT